MQILLICNNLPNEDQQSSCSQSVLRSVSVCKYSCIQVNELRLTAHYSKRVPFASNKRTVVTKAFPVTSETYQHLCMYRSVNIFAPLIHTVCKTFQTIANVIALSLSIEFVFF